MLVGMMTRIIAAMVLALLAVSGTARADQAALELGRAFADDFRQGRLDVLWEQMTPRMQEALGGNADALEEVRTALQAQLGGEQKVLSEETGEADGHRLYVRIAEHEKVDVPIITQFAFDGEDRIAGFFVRPQRKAATCRARSSRAS